MSRTICQSIQNQSHHYLRRRVFVVVHEWWLNAVLEDDVKKHEDRGNKV